MKRNLVKFSPRLRWHNSIRWSIISMTLRHNWGSISLMCWITSALSSCIVLGLLTYTLTVSITWSWWPINIVTMWDNKAIFVKSGTTSIDDAWNGPQTSAFKSNEPCKRVYSNLYSNSHQWCLCDSQLTSCIVVGHQINRKFKQIYFLKNL